MDVKSHYQQLFERYGDSPRAVQWGDLETQKARFEILAQIAPTLDSVIDVGCGLGHLYEHLKTREPELRYLGLDFVEEFVLAARQKLATEHIKFQIFDLLKDPLPEGYDFALLSGVFNNAMDDNWGFMKQALSTMYAGAQRGIAFNAMSTYVDYQDDGLFYVDPCKVFDFCKKSLGRRVVLRHDYFVRDGSIPFEFAIYVYK